MDQHNQYPPEDQPHSLTDEERQQFKSEFFIELLEQDGMPELPEDEILIRFAEGTLKDSERKEIQALARQNIAASVILADFVKEYAPIRNLARGWSGWKGAILYALHRLPEDVSSVDWRAHLERNPRSRRKTEIAVGSLRPALPLALAGWACALLLSFQLHTEKPLPPNSSTGDNSAVSSKSPDHPGETIKAPGPRSIAAALCLDSHDPEKLGYCIEDMRQISDRYPDSIAAHYALVELGLKRASLVKNPEERRKMEDLARNEREKALHLEQQLGK